MENTAGSRPVPVPEDKIDSLPHTKYSSTECERPRSFVLWAALIFPSAANTLTKDCAVCKDDFEEEQEIITLPCRHAFHDECIVPWLKVNGTCPVCRFELVPQPKPGHPAAADGGHGTQGADGGASTNQNQEQSQGGSGMFGGRSTPRQSNNGVGGQGPGQQQFSGSWSGQGQWQGTSGMFSGRINPNQPNDGGGGGGQRSGQSSDQQHQQQFPGGWDDLD
jgi:E3 ubiquitin-protein ligase RNF115/126